MTSRMRKAVRKQNRVLVAAMLVGLILGSGLPAFAWGWKERAAKNAQTLQHAGVTRTYVIRISPEIEQNFAKNAVRVPLVLVLHGGGGNAENAERMTGFSEKARKEGFIVAYPEGSNRRGGELRVWNAGHCCGYAMEEKIDDVGFINALLDHLVQNYPVDPKRIYVTGMSNGGMMTHRLGIELAGRIAAIAPVVATVFGDEKKPAHPVAALMINGMLDESVPHQGGPPGGIFRNTWDDVTARPAIEQAVFWANTNRCEGAPALQDRDTFRHWQYPCAKNRSVELYLVKDNGHAWPGGQKGHRRGDPPSPSFRATDVIWDFFKAQTK